MQALDSHVPLAATALDSSRVEAPVGSQGTEKLDIRSEWQSKRVAFVFVYFFQGQSTHIDQPSDSALHDDSQ